MRKRARKASPLVTEGGGSSDTTPVQSVWEGGGDSCGVMNMEVMVHRSSVAPCVSCLLCGGFLREAITIPDCLHSFCRECILEKFRIEDINCCPKCDIDLGSSPLKKLRTDHSLQAIRSTIFPAERHKVEDIAPLYPEELALPRSSPQAHGVDNSAEATNPFLVCEPKNAETETEECERLETEPSASLAKLIASSPHTAVAPATGPTLPVLSAGSGNRQRDAQREDTLLALREGERTVEEHRGEIEGIGVEVYTPISELAVQSEDLKCEHRSLIDKQDTTQERNTLANEMDTFICHGDERKTRTATGSPLSTEAEVTVQKTVALLSAASQSEAEEENTARILGMAETDSGRRQGLKADTARIRDFRNFEKKKAEETTFERTRISEELLQRKFETAQTIMGILKRIDAYIGPSQAFEAETARLRVEHENERARNLEKLQIVSGDTILREELEYERAEKAAAFERVRVLEEKLRTESEIAQKAVASHRLLFQEHQALELQSYDKIDRLSRSLAEARISVAEQKGNAAEARISVAEQKCNSRVMDEMMAKVVEERDQLKSELENVMKKLARAEAFARTINDILARHLCGSLKRTAERGMKIKINDPSTEEQEMTRLLPEEMARHGIKIDPSSILEDRILSVLTESPHFVSVGQHGSGHLKGALQ